MKRVLGMMGSPRKNGNTHVMISKILEGSEDAGAKTEIIILKDLVIKECDGCHTCWKGNDCSKNDDMNNLFQKISSNDVIISGTPVYWYGPTALIKACLDRFVYFNCPENHEKIENIKAVLAIPFEEESEETAEILLNMFKKSFEYLKIPLIEKVLAPGVDKRGEVSKRDDIMNLCYNIGKRIVN